MSGANNRTINVDTLFVRDIVFKDFSNRPIAANQLLVSRGDGGTYFGNLPYSTNSTFYQAINEVDAPTADGGLYKFVATAAYNTLLLEPGAGMEFYSNSVNGGLIIYNTGPEQIIADGQTLAFSALKDNLVGGRTLYYQGLNDINLYVSDATVFFDSATNSSISTIYQLQSTSIGLETEFSTMNGELYSSIQTINILYYSSGLAFLTSSVNQQTNFINNISSYFLVTNQINISTVSTTNLTINQNVIRDIALNTSIYDPCVVYTGDTIISTNTDFLTFTDQFTNVTFAIDKEYLYAASTLFYGPSTTTVTKGQQVQLGWFPGLSTQGNLLSLRSQFVPFVQQIQVMQYNVFPNNTSTVTDYYIKNVGKFDELCSPNNLSLAVNNVITSSILLSSINGAQPINAVGSNFGDYLYWNGSAWTTGYSTIHIGDQAGGDTFQGEAAIAIGAYAGNYYQLTNAIAIGKNAGSFVQGENTVAIGFNAGTSNQGINSIAIGANAGVRIQDNNTIILNATGDPLNTTTRSAFFVAPIRYDPVINNAWLQYNTGTNEVVWNQNGGGGGGGGSNLPAASNYGDYLFYSGVGWVTGYSTIRIGDQAGGDSFQGEAAIAIGAGAGYSNQSGGSIAIGQYAGISSQTTNSIAIGASAGLYAQRGGVALGYFAGAVNQGRNAIAIGTYAGSNAQSNASIVINASGVSLNVVQPSSFYVSPIRDDPTASNIFIQYNTATKEVVYNANQIIAAKKINTSSIRASTIIVSDTAFISSLVISSINATAGIFNTLYVSSLNTNTITTNMAFISSLVTSTINGLQISGYNNSVGMGTSTNIRLNQGSNAVAIGAYTGEKNQSTNAVAIGAYAGKTFQGSNAVAIGYAAGQDNQSTNTIVLNATGIALNTAVSSSLYIAPIRLDTSVTTNAIAYNTVTKEVVYNTAKTFVIDHPKDETKYLVHACLEGPEAGVYYRGTGTISNNTSTTVTLPDYVDALATDFTVQVTPIYNGVVRTLNTSKISNNEFTVFGISGDFDWHVYGRRALVDVEPKKSSVNILGSGPYRWIN